MRPPLAPQTLGHPQQLAQRQGAWVDAEASGDPPDIAPRIVSSMSSASIRVSTAVTAASIMAICLATALARSLRPRDRKKAISSS